MDSCKRLLLANRAWAVERLKIKPDYFESHVETQSPEFLWIGCSDSRVPAEEITGAEPGELFVHRNVANLVVPTDLNMLSVLQYAVEVLQVKHVVVCGHYNCGGIKSAMSNLRNLGPIHDWLQHLRDLYGAHLPEMEAISDAQGRWDRMVEINIKEQLDNLARTSIIQRAWSRESRPMLHGWAYNLRTGYLDDLSVLEPKVKVPDNVYRFEERELKSDRG